MTIPRTQQQEAFLFDVFLSHSSADKLEVRGVAERLRKDGLRVWFDEWLIKPGDSIHAKVEEGLETSRILVFCMSASAFGSDWAHLEAGTFRFRDPLNKNRRFIPLRLDDAPIPGSLAQFLFVDWRGSNREQQYRKLLEACTPSVEKRALPSLQSATSQLHFGKRPITACVFNPAGTRALTATTDGTLRVSDIASGNVVSEIRRTGERVDSIFWSDTEKRAVTFAGDRTSVWDVERSVVLNHPQRELTRREMDVFRLCGRGLLASEMTPPLSIHQITIGFHLQAARTKLGLSARSDLREFASSFYTRGADSLGLSLADADPRWIAPLAWRIELAHALSGGDQTRLRLCSRCDEGWFGPSTPNVEARQLVWNSHRSEVLCAGASDATVQQWDPRTGRCLRLLEGHAGRVSSIARHPARDYAASASEDRTVRIWDLQKGTCLAVLDGTQHHFVGVGWTADGKKVLAADQGGAVVVWDVEGLLSERGLPSREAPHWEKQVQYSNAKVLLVGDSGVGKSGLSNYLAHGTRVSSSQQLPSTDGAWATHWPLTTKDNGEDARKEIWLWDFAGQVDYRLVHQLFMDHTAAAVLVFNPQNENPFDGLGHWDRDLRKAATEPFAKLLAAGRIDRGGLVVSATTVKKFMEEHDFLPPLHETSALTGDGCEQLRQAILSAVNWESIPKTTSPALYRRMKTEILSLRDSGIVLLRLAELKQRLEMQLEGEHFELSELEAVVSLLAGPGMVKRLDFGGFILLRPEVLSRYAAAVVRRVRQHPLEIGCIREDEFLAGNLDFQDFQRLAPEDEAVVLRALLETFVSRAWCLRQLNEDAALLVFPSYFRRERPEQPGHPHVLVTYQFDGPTDEVYATLVVRLSHLRAPAHRDHRIRGIVITQNGAS